MAAPTSTVGVTAELESMVAHGGRRSVIPAGDQLLFCVCSAAAFVSECQPPVQSQPTRLSSSSCVLQRWPMIICLSEADQRRLCPAG